MNTTEIGKKAERAAAQELKRRGFQIIDINWKVPSCEIDIVAQRHGCIYLCEVKYRATALQGDGLEYIHQSKLAQMSRAAETWVQHNTWEGPYQLIGISVDGGFQVSNLIEICN